MTYSYSWRVTELIAYPKQGDLTDVVVGIGWELTAEDEASHKGIAQGTQFIPIDPEALFTRFEELTEEQVLGWVLGDMTEEVIANYQAACVKQIEDQINPPVAVLTPPWLA